MNRGTNKQTNQRACAHASPTHSLGHSPAPSFFPHTAVNRSLTHPPAACQLTLNRPHPPSTALNRPRPPIGPPPPARLPCPPAWPTCPAHLTCPGPTQILKSRLHKQSACPRTARPGTSAAEAPSLSQPWPGQENHQQPDCQEQGDKPADKAA